MAPKSKKKGKKKMAPPVVEVSKEELHRIQLEAQFARLHEELEWERKQKVLTERDRDNILANLERYKQEVEQVKDELRLSCQHREEAQQRCQVEISIYRQKLKHVLTEQHKTICELRIDSATSASLIQNEHTKSELELQTTPLQAESREKTVLNKDCLEKIKTENQEKLLELTINYDRTLRDLENNFNQRKQAAINAEEQKRWSMVNELGDTMNALVVTLVEEHGQALKQIEEYYASLHKEELANEKELKDEAVEVKYKLMRVDIKLSAAQRENQRLRDTLHEAEEKLPRLQMQVDAYNQTKTMMLKSGARVMVAEKELWDLTIEHELLWQTYEKVQKERDELQRRLTEAMLKAKQRNGLRQMLLERKLAALTQTVETNEAQLHAALAPAAAAPDTAGAKLKETLDSKQATLTALTEDLAREHQEYKKLMQACINKLKALNIPLSDFPFKPMKQTLRVNTTTYV